MFMHSRSGVVVLPTILIFGVLIIGIVLTGIFLVRTVNQANFNVRLGAEALAGARSAISDAHVRLIRGDVAVGQSCASGYAPTSNYSLPSLGRLVVDVFMCRDVCGVNDCQYRVRADAQSTFFVRRRVEAVFNADVVTGEIRITSIASVDF